MIHAGTGDHNKREEDGNSRVEGPCNSRIEACFAEGTHQPEHKPEEVELGDFGANERQEAAELDDDCMDAGVCPAADCIVGGVLPSLQAISMIEIMCGLPVVEYLVAILDRCV